MNYFQKKIYQEIQFLSNFYDQSYLFKKSYLSSQDINNKYVIEDINQINTSSDNSLASLVILDGNLNFSQDIIGELSTIRQKLTPQDRVIILAYNSYFNWLYRLLSIIGFRKKNIAPNNTLSKSTLASIVEIADFEITSTKPLIYFPFSALYIGSIINTILAPISFISSFSICQSFTLRPVNFPRKNLSLSIIVPLRNEAGNIERIFEQLSLIVIDKLEMIFVEGNSTDNSWELLQSMPEKLKSKSVILKQPDIGKNDAVTFGINSSSNDLIIIFDADLTVDISQISYFHQIICLGKADLVNGNRLFYTFEEGAMRLLNWIGNVFFAKFLSYIFNSHISDTLCGTKLFYRRDYIRFLKWNNKLKIQDPFGDFKLLMPALDLGVGICDLPVYYRSRKYGTTNISRFRDGFLLLKIALVTLWKRKIL